MSTINESHHEAQDPVNLDPSSVPAELTKRPQWVVWRTTNRNGKTTKPPYSVRTGRLADCRDSETWSEFPTVLAAFRKSKKLEGLGFVLSADDPYVGIDLDKCRDPDTGVIEPGAQKIVNRLQSYTEVSPSGTGLHVWLRGKLPSGRRRRGHIEMYDCERYLTVTGKHLEGTPATIEDRQAHLESLHAEVFAKTNSTPQPDTTAPVAATARSAVESDDAELIDRALQSRNRNGEENFALLWKGEWEGRWKSLSEASLSLCVGTLRFGRAGTPRALTGCFASRRYTRCAPTSGSETITGTARSPRPSRARGGCTTPQPQQRLHGKGERGEETHLPPPHPMASAFQMTESS
jgi:putative DNA primase/helicase